MGKIPFYNEFAEQNSSFNEKRMVFLSAHGADHGAHPEPKAEKEEVPEPQLPKSEIDSLSAVEKEALKKFRETSDAETKFGNGVSTIDIGALNVVKYVTESARSQIHHIESSPDQLLDLRVTEQLRKRIAEIEGLNPEDKTHTKKINKAVKKYNSRERINAEIAKLTKQINNLDDSLFNPEMLYPQKAKEQRAVLQVKLDRLRELAKAETETRAEETKKMEFLNETSAETLASDFDWLDNPDENTWFAHSEYSRLRELLPPSELHGWKKSEQMRVLLFHIKNENYRRLLDSQNSIKVRGTDVKTHFKEDNGEVGVISKEIKDAINGKTLTALNTELAAGKTGLQISDSSTSDDVASIKDIFDLDAVKAAAELENAEAELTDSLTKANPALKPLRIALKKAQANAEIAKTKLERTRKKIEELQQKKKELETKINDLTARGLYTQNRQNVVDNLNLELGQINQEITSLDPETVAEENFSKAEEQVGEAEFNIEAKEKDLEDKQRKALVGKKQKVETARKKLKTSEEKRDKYSTALDSLVDLKTRKADAEKAAKDNPVSLKSPGEIFTNLEVELAKADMCSRVGKDNTADLSPAEKAEAEKIGRLSANMKLVSWSSENQKAENTVYLNRLAERNKGLGEKFWGGTKNLAGKYAPAIGNDIKECGKDFLQVFLTPFKKKKKGGHEHH